MYLVLIYFIASCCICDGLAVAVALNLGLPLHARRPHVSPLPHPGLRPPLVLENPGRIAVPLLEVTSLGRSHPARFAHGHEPVHHSRNC